MRHQSSSARARTPIVESEVVVRPFTIVPRPAKKKIKAPTGFYRRKGSPIWYFRRRIDKVLINESTAFTDLEDAKRWAEDKVHNFRYGNLGWSPKNMPTMQEHYDARTYKTEYDEQHVLPFVQAHAKDKIDTITDETCRAWIKQRLARITRTGRLVAPGTVRTECLFLGAYFNRAVGRKKLLRENPWRLVDIESKVKLPPPGDRDRQLEPKEQAAFFAALATLRTRLLRGIHHDPVMFQRIAQVIIGSGLRRKEILGLAPADVHDGAIYVPAALAKRHKARTVPVGADVLALLETQRQARGLDRRSNLRYFPVGLNYLNTLFARASVAANLETPVTPHDLRRTYASRMAFKVIPKVLQLLLGHADIKTTMKHYVKVGEMKLAEVVLAAGSPLDV